MREGGREGGGKNRLLGRANLVQKKNDRKNMKLYMLYSPERGEYKEPSPVFFRSLVLDWQKKLAKQAFPGPPSNYVE